MILVSSGDWPGGAGSRLPAAGVPGGPAGAAAAGQPAHLDLVVDVGKHYGLELNSGKTILLKIRSSGVVHGPDGKAITCKESAVYLGGL